MNIDMVDIELVSGATLTLDTIAGHPLEHEQVQRSSVVFDTEPYYVRDGLPVADTALGVGALAELGVGDLASLSAYPIPMAAPIVAGSRFLPVADTYDQSRWRPVSGTDRIDLAASGMPYLDTSYDYVRGRSMTTGEAMRLDDGAYLLADGARWTATDLLVLMVAVLHTPRWSPSYALLESVPIDGQGDGQTYFSLRYRSDGTISMNCLGLLYDGLHTASRPGAPMILGVHLSAAPTMTTVVLDRTLTCASQPLTSRHPYDGRLYVGTSNEAGVGTATMDILELDYWTDEMTQADVLARVHELDALYGVSTG